MKKLKFLFFPTILALAFGLILSCAKKEDPPKEDTSSAVTVSGKVQKGPRSKMLNKSKHADLVKMSLFLKKHSKKPPTSPNRCLRR